MIPVSVIIVTKNESKNILNCLDCLTAFDDVWVVDSKGADNTASLATTRNVKTVPFQWNGQYPKKRQWCLNELNLKYDWVYFVDADEITPPSLVDEIKSTIDGYPAAAGYFITGLYRFGDKILKHGIPNRKIALLHKDRMEFPVVNDLDIPGMGEIEGHYQPVLKSTTENYIIGSLQQHMIHTALSDERAWNFRHEKYARWEAGMNAKNAWPIDPVPWRQFAKSFLRQSSFRAEIVYLIGLIGKFAFLDGAEGMKLLKMRYHYLKMIKRLS